MSFTTLFKPGSIVYNSGHGISVITGRKVIAITGLPDQSAWELRTLHDFGVTTFILESRIPKSNVRGFSSRQDLETALSIFINRKISNKQNLRQFINQTEALISSNNPYDIALAIACLIHTNNVKTPDLMKIEIKKADQIKKAVTLLAEDLSMVSGLSVSAARDHIFSLAFSTDKIDIWPVQATKEKPTALDNDSFREIFGITIDQAYNLNDHPLKIISSSGADKDSTVSLIRAYLNQSAASKISNPVKAFLTKNPHRQEEFNEIMQLAYLRGAGHESIEFVLPRLDENAFYAFARHYLVRPENRLPLEELANKLNLSSGNLTTILANSIKHIKEMARVQGKYEIIEYLSKQVSAEKPVRPTKKPNVYSEGDDRIMSRAYASLSFLIPNGGPKRGAFGLAVKVLEGDALYIFTYSHLVKKEHALSKEALAEKYKLSVDEVNYKLNEAIKILAEEARRQNLISYITHDMIKDCPEAGEIIGKENLERPNPIIDTSHSTHTSSYIPEDIRKLSLEEDKYAPARGFTSILYKLAQQNLSAIQFAVYVGGDIRTKDHRLSIEQLSETLGLSRDEIISIRNEAITLIKKAIEDNYIKMPGNNVNALTQTVGRAKRPYNRKQKSSSGSETFSNNNQSEDDIFAEMRVKGFDENSLYNLGAIYENRGNFKLAILFYGAACDLSDNLFVEALQRVEIQLGYLYNPSTDFPVLEEYIQNKLNEAVDADIHLTSTFKSHALGDDINEEVIEAEYQEVEPLEPSASQQSPSENLQPPIQPHISYSLPPEIFAVGRRLRMSFESRAGGFEVTLQVEDVQPQSDVEPDTICDVKGSQGGLNVSFTHNANGAPVIQVGTSKSPDTKDFTPV